MRQLDRRILAERDPLRLGERAFFGDFFIRPDATLRALDDAYRFGIDPADANLSVGEFLLRRYPRPVVGDRIRLGGVEFVVREVNGNRVTRVGLKTRLQDEPG